MADWRRRADRVERMEKRSRMWAVLRIVLVVVVGAGAITLAVIAILQNR